MVEPYQSFGRYPKVTHKKINKLFWIEDSEKIDFNEYLNLPYGLGKSYGDSCLNDGEALIDTSALNRFIDFNNENGTVKAEAGVTLEQILDLIVPHNYFLASTPGTKKITLGGAIANDVHGKNHHKGGTFGCHVLQFELLKSDGSRIICSNKQNTDLFKATIGGLGLTGLILWAEFKVQKIQSEFIKMESIKFESLEEFFEINEESNRLFDYTVSWIDTTATGSNLGRGLFSRGNFAEKSEIPNIEIKKGNPLPFLFDCNFINPISVQTFNSLYFNKQIDRKEKSIVHYNPFFYPLDAISNWQLAYGKNGFLQYQFVLPFENCKSNLYQIFKIIVDSGLSSFLTVLKQFGDIKSPGLLSFPRPGITLAIDFAMSGNKVLEVLNETDKIVRKSGGVIYPGKDARMSGENFRAFYPQFEEFSKFVDERFSSSFWRRVMRNKK